MLVEKDGTVVIKVPKRTRKAAIEMFYNNNLDWIAVQRNRIQQDKDKYIPLSQQDINRLKKQAREQLSAKTEYYGKIMNLSPEYVKITSARTHWGTCHKKGDKYSICYSYRTIFLPDRVQDYIVVHELAHMVHFDHSPAFYALVEKILPDWCTLSAQAANFKDYHIY